MSKGLIIGLAGLGIGAALAGGVAGYFIGKPVTKSQIPETNYKGEKFAEDFTDFDFPDEFNYTSHSIYDISEKYAMFSSGSIGSYLLNKETKEFSFFNSASVNSTSDIVNGYKYFWLSNYNLFKINVNTGKYEVVALNSGVAFNQLSFVGSKDNMLYIKGTNNSGNTTNYYFLAFDTVKGKSDVYSITSSQYNYFSRAFDLGDYYYLTYTTNTHSSSSSTYSSFLLSKNTQAISTISSYYLYDENAYFVRGSKMYAVLRQSYSDFIFSVDLATGTTSQITSVNGGGKFFEYKQGVVYSTFRDIESDTYYNSSTAYYISFADDSATALSYNSVSSSMYAYEFNGQVLYCPYTGSTYSYGVITTFDEATKELTPIFTSLVTSQYSHCTIYKFDGRYYVSSDSANFSEMIVKSDGTFEFKRVSLKCSPTSTHYELGNSKYLFVHDGIKFYDFETDTYKSLLSGSNSIKDLQIKGNIVTIYVSNHYKYEFNLTSLTFKAVAYWE